MNSLTFLFAALFLCLSIHVAADDTPCEYPCTMQNNCVCNHTLLTVSGGQNFGTCIACGNGWSGFDCSVVGSACFNGGVESLNITTNVSSGCTCKPGWGGSQCGDQQCINSIGGVGPLKVVPVNATNQCGSCEAGYTGLNCDMCTSDAQCPIGKKCITSPMSLGDTKKLFCELTDPYWVAMMSYFRTGVKAYATMECDGPIPLDSYTYYFGYPASCYISVWRLEPNGTWFDPFFYVTGQNCTMGYRGRTVKYGIPLPMPAEVAVIRNAMSGVIYFVLALIVLNGISFTKKQSPASRVKRFRVLGSLLVVLIAAFIFFCALYGHKATPSTVEDALIIYKCLHSKATCAEDPPKYHDYMPRCKGSTMDKYFFPSMTGIVQVSCNLAGVCNLEQQNLGYTPISLQCVAAECTSQNSSNYYTPPGNGGNTTSATIPELSGVGAVVFGATVFILYSIYSARKLSVEFRAAFDQADGTRSLQQRDGNVQDPLLTSGGGYGGISISGSEVQLDLRNAGYSVNGNPILFGASLSVKSGEVVAVMGASGAGKTTLLDILAVRDKQGVITGELQVNGIPINSSNMSTYKRMIGYVAQSDNLIPALTVRQSIHFAARLKLPAPIDNSVIDDLVDDVIEKLHLKKCAHTVVGNDSDRGISGGEKRRVSIATELVASPRILFLDEPTSGLDSVSATEVMRAIANLARSSSVKRYSTFFPSRPSVIFSIHQPSAEIFALFDRLVVVSQGNITYSGPAKEALTRMVAAAGMAGVPNSTNDAETILRLDFNAEPAQLLLMKTAVQSPPNYTVDARQENVLEFTKRNQRFYPNALQQFGLLSRRTWCSLMGSYYLIMCHAFATLFLSLMLSFLYHKETLDLAGTEDKAGMMTFMLLVVAFSSISSLDLFISEKKLFVVERDNGYYRTGAYFTTKVLFDFIPLRIIPATIFSAVIYYPMGLRHDKGSAFAWFVGIVVMFQLFVTGICLCVATLAPTFGAGSLYSALIILWHCAFGGLMIQSTTIPHGFVWCKFLSPFYFAYEALMVNELDGLQCTFDPSNAEGQHEGIIVPILCKQFLYNLGLDPVNFSRDVAALWLWTIAYLIIAVILLCFLRVRV